MFARTAVKVLKMSSKVWCYRMGMLLPIFFYSFLFCLPEVHFYLLYLYQGFYGRVQFYMVRIEIANLFDDKQKCFKSSARTRGAKINLTLGFLNSRGSLIQSHNSA